VLAHTLDSGELGSNGIAVGVAGGSQGLNSVLLGNPIGQTVHVQVKQDDGTLSDVSRTLWSTRGTRIPMPGAPEALGVLNVVRPTWDPAKGNVGVRTGSSYIQVVALNGDSCPDAATLLTTSESNDPTSPYYADQTRMFSAGQWVTARFCEKDILASPALEVVNLS
jgi:Penicillin amidase